MRLHGFPSLPWRAAGSLLVDRRRRRNRPGTMFRVRGAPARNARGSREDSGVIIDLTSDERLTRTDAYLLLLAAQNHVLFREREWHWVNSASVPGKGSRAREEKAFEASARIVARTARTFQDAMYRLRQDGRDINLSPGVARSFASGGAGRLR